MCMPMRMPKVCYRTPIYQRWKRFSAIDAGRNSRRPTLETNLRYQRRKETPLSTASRCSICKKQTYIFVACWPLWSPVIAYFVPELSKPKLVGKNGFSPYPVKKVCAGIVCAHARSEHHTRNETSQETIRWKAPFNVALHGNKKG